MKVVTSLFLAFLLAASTATAQQAKPQAPGKSALPMTGITTLMAFGKERGTQELARVVGMVGFYGQDQPRQWRILADDAHERGMLKEYIVENGHVVAERRFQRDPKVDLPTIRIPSAKLSVDSRQAFLLAEGAARVEGVGFDTIHYQLRCRDLRSEPVWVLNLSDQQRKTVGVVYVSALNGELLRKVWTRPGSAEYQKQGQHKEGLGDYLQRGADFFTDTFNAHRAKINERKAANAKASTATAAETATVVPVKSTASNTP